jgi:predicted double-glycine peptidase
MKFIEWLAIREGAIKTPVPTKPQEFKHSCGAGALRSILHYFGINKTEEEVRKATDTNKNGTQTQDIIKAARHFGLNTKAKYNMDVQDLKDWLDQNKPVLICFQAWGSKKYYKTKESGHYAVAIGYDDKNVYFQDPSIHSKTRGHLSWKEFVKRWHDKDAKGNERDRYGIAMWKSGAKTKETINKSKRIK